MDFRVAIIGRPNVGKSTLFNRLVGRKLALVDNTPGVTRDRREEKASLGDLYFTAIDTAGLEEAKAGSLSARMRAQTEAAVKGAHVALFMIDARAGITPVDEQFAKVLRRFGKRVILVANKAENKTALANAQEAYRLGFGEPVPLSAEHGEGLSDLLSALSDQIPMAEKDETAGAEKEDGSLRLAVIGRPNAGKSTLINYLLGEERLLTGPEPGITRDSIEISWTWRNHKMKLFDTAGIRRKARVQEKLEKLSVADALRAIRFAHVVVLLTDNENAFDKQDLQLADLVIKEGRALILGINKWDKVENSVARRKELEEVAARLLPQVKHLPLVTLSGLTGKNVERLLETAISLEKIWSKRVPTSALNRWFEHALAKNPPPAVSGRRIKLNYATQVSARPPTFAAFGTRPEKVPESYRRYLINSLSEAFDLQGVPIRLHMRGKDNPYEGRRKQR